MTPAETIVAARTDPDRVVLEGLHALKHAVRFGATVDAVLVGDRPEYERLVADLAPDLPERLTVDPVSCPAEQWARLAPPRLPSPVLACARRPQGSVADALAVPGPIVLLDRPRHLGNLGAVVRVVAAAGLRGLLVLGGGDPWHPTALRGGAGLQFALAIATVGEVPDLGGRRLVAVDPGGARLGSTLRRDDDVLAFGSERDGLSPALRLAAAASVAIPMRGGVSSLNLATAVAAVVYAGGWARPSA